MTRDCEKLSSTTNPKRCSFRESASWGFFMDCSGMDKPVVNAIAPAARSTYLGEGI